MANATSLVDVRDKYIQMSSYFQRSGARKPKPEEPFYNTPTRDPYRPAVLLGWLRHKLRGGYTRNYDFSFQ